MPIFYFSNDEEGVTFFSNTHDLLNQDGVRIQDCYVYEGDTTEERIREGDDDYRELTAVDYLEGRVVALQASEAKLTAENEKLKADADDGDLVYSEEDLSELKEGWGEVLQDEIDVLKADQVLLEGWLEEAREQLGVLEEREDSELEKIGALEYDISENQIEHKKENKKITDHRDRILKKMRRQTKDNDQLKEQHLNSLIQRDNANSFIEQSDGWVDFQDYLKDLKD
tara:strand:- start:599 stop:1279 length:681 start_codon:yes stop_codon:yes gene_type:complete